MDERFLRELRKRWGSDVRIAALDASGRFQVKEAIEAIHRMTPFEPGLVESPVKGRHRAAVEDFLAVKEAVQVPLCEHIADDSVAARLGKDRAVDVFNLGPGYSGLESCRRRFAVAKVFGMKTLMGSTVELSIGTAARAHFAAAIPNLDLPCYMAGPLVYYEQVVRKKVVYRNGSIQIPEGAGLGLELDPERLARHRI